MKNLVLIGLLGCIFLSLQAECPKSTDSFEFDAQSRSLEQLLTEPDFMNVAKIAFTRMPLTKGMVVTLYGGDCFSCDAIVNRECDDEKRLALEEGLNGQRQMILRDFVTSTMYQKLRQDISTFVGMALHNVGLGEKEIAQLKDLNCYYPDTYACNDVDEFEWKKLLRKDYWADPFGESSPEDDNRVIGIQGRLKKNIGLKKDDNGELFLTLDISSTYLFKTIEKRCFGFKRHPWDTDQKSSDNMDSPASTTKPDIMTATPIPNIVVLPVCTEQSCHLEGFLVFVFESKESNFIDNNFKNEQSLLGYEFNVSEGEMVSFVENSTSFLPEGFSLGDLDSKSAAVEPSLHYKIFCAYNCTNFTLPEIKKFIIDQGFEKTAQFINESLKKPHSLIDYKGLSATTAP